MIARSPSTENQVTHAQPAWRFCQLLIALSISQGALLLLLPILAWLGVKIGTIGQLRQFQAAMGLLSIVLTGQLELLIPAAKTLKESHSLLASAKLSVCWLAGGLITLGLAISLNWFYLLLVIAASCEAWTRINKFSSARHKNISAATTGRLTFGLTSLIIQPLAALAGGVSFVFISIDTLARVMSAAASSLCLNADESLTILLKNQYDVEKRRRSGLKSFLPHFPKFSHIRLGLPLTIGQSAALWCHMLPAILLPELFGTESAGQWAIAYSIVMIPTLLIGQSVTHVLLGELNSPENGHPNSIYKTLRNAGILLAFAGCLLTCLLLLVLPVIIPAIFGDKIELVVNLIPIVCMTAIGTLLGNPLSHALLRLGNLKLKVRFHVTMSFILSGIVLLGSLTDISFESTMLLYSCGILLSEILIALLTLRIAYLDDLKNNSLQYFRYYTPEAA